MPSRCQVSNKTFYWVLLFIVFVVCLYVYLSPALTHQAIHSVTGILNGNINTGGKVVETERRWSAVERVYGPGEYGVGLEIKEEDLDEGELAKYREGYDEHRFNEYASDLISLHRKLPPVLQDERCKALVYPSNLPNVSVVIPFKDEAWSTLLRTVHGVLERSDPKLLKEIILVDDNSTLPPLKNKLDIYLRQLPNVTVVRLKNSTGLMMARQAGIDRALCDVIIVMDSHIEVTDGWLEPLLLPIYRDSKILTYSRLLNIDKDTFRLTTRPLETLLQMPSFDFYLNMAFSPLRKEFTRKRNIVTDPVPSPAIQGGLFAIDRKFFGQLGGFDPGMKAWGGEQLELSFKIWMCGGQILTPPCSMAGHVYRKVKWKDIWNTYHRNNYRLASVWMDEYYDLYRERTASIADPGDVNDRKAIRKMMQCKSFEWYLQTIEKFVNIYVPRNRKAKGTIRNRYLDLCIQSEFHGDKEFVPKMMKCRDGWGQDWDMSEKDEVRHQHQCFDIGKDMSVVSNVCDHRRIKPSQKWIYTKYNTLLHKVTKKCLAAETNGKSGSELLLVTCDHKSARQLWKWTRLKT